VTIFAASSLACGLTQSISQLIMARSIQGMGAALLVPGSLAIISSSFDEKNRGSAIGTWSGFTAITTAVGPVLGGWLVEHASWRWAFFINIPIAAAVIAISLAYIPESRSAVAAQVDWWGTLFATVGLGALVTGFIESANLGWSNPVVFGSLIVGTASLVAFAFVERRVRSPIVPLSIFESRSFSGANLLTLFLYGAIGIFFFLLPLNLIQVQGYSATATGAAMLPFIFLMFFLSRWSGGLIARYGPRIPLIIGPLIAAFGFVFIAVPSMSGNYWKTFFPAIMILGFGMAVTVAPLTTVVMNSVDQNRVGTASGVNNAVARVAGVLAIAVFGVVMVKAFGVRLNHSLRDLSLPADVLQQLQANEIKLAALPVPPGLDPGMTAAVKHSIAEAFVFGFRIVMLICAGLCVVSAANAWRMIPNRSQMLEG
jgi:EmrB/QacA subfamily drug resistance transporter